MVASSSGWISIVMPTSLSWFWASSAICCSCGEAFEIWNVNDDVMVPRRLQLLLGLGYITLV